ncbi:MAG: hypothetical protein ACKKMW_02105 [Candidatus Nealsonbacteria bacterium]
MIKRFVIIIILFSIALSCSADFGLMPSKTNITDLKRGKKIELAFTILNRFDERKSFDVEILNYTKEELGNEYLMPDVDWFKCDKKIKIDASGIVKCKLRVPKKAMTGIYKTRVAIGLLETESSNGTSLSVKVANVLTFEVIGTWHWWDYIRQFFYQFKSRLGLASLGTQNLELVILFLLLIIGTFTFLTIIDWWKTKREN